MSKPQWTSHLSQMIPNFPDFKKIELADRASVEAYTSKYLPYSDFNFTNLWSLNPKAKDGRMISQLNGNLVVLFTDYQTNELSLSFLGTNRTQETVLALIDYAKTNGIKTTLNYIAQESVNNLQNSTLLIEEDYKNFDYIFSVPEMANPQGSELRTKRHLANRFMHQYPEAVYKLLDLRDESTHEMIISVLRRWENNKISDNKSYELEHEEIALKRLLRTANDHQLILSGVFYDEEMLGFSLDEILPNQYAISHFFKADTTYKGIYEFLNEKVAQYLLTRKVELWNWEQDLSIEGLRMLKMSYRPATFLKKFKVSLIEQ